LKAKKSYGQHFLIQEEIAHEIVDKFIEANTTGRALEVGPGLGVLTKQLAESYTDLIAVDADRDMIAVLAKSLSHVKTIEGDFLKLDFKDIFNGKAFGIIGNFPYNISSQIVFKMIDNRDQVPILVGMFQKEMAERIVSKPGNKVYGVISVLTQAYYYGELIIQVGPESFSPRPKVDSAVIILKRREKDNIQYNEVLFKDIVKTSFLHRRKMIRNTMKQWLSEEEMKDPFYNRRPETLSVQEFINLTQLITSKI